MSVVSSSSLRARAFWAAVGSAPDAKPASRNRAIGRQGMPYAITCVRAMYPEDVMHLELPEIIAPAKLSLDPSQTMSDEEYFEFCSANEKLRIERTAQGDIVIMPPA